MATVPILSKAMTLTYDSKVIARTTDFSLEINKEVVDITTLASAGWKEKDVDLKEWNISFNSLVTRGADGTWTVYDELLADILGTDTTITVSVDDTGGGGTISVGGSVFLTSLSASATVGDKFTYSGTLDGTGALA